MKFATFLYLICALTVSNSEREEPFQCASPNCDKKISEAIVRAKYVKEDVPITLLPKDVVEIYGKRSKVYYIKKGEQYSFAPKDFIQERKIIVPANEVKYNVILNPQNATELPTLEKSSNYSVENIPQTKNIEKVDKVSRHENLFVTSANPFPPQLTSSEIKEAEVNDNLDYDTNSSLNVEPPNTGNYLDSNSEPLNGEKTTIPSLSDKRREEPIPKTDTNVFPSKVGETIQPTLYPTSFNKEEADKTSYLISTTAVKSDDELSQLESLVDNEKSVTEKLEGSQLSSHEEETASESVELPKSSNQSEEVIETSGEMLFKNQKEENSTAEPEHQMKEVVEELNVTEPIPKTSEDNSEQTLNLTSAEALASEDSISGTSEQIEQDSFAANISSLESALNPSQNLNVQPPLTSKKLESESMIEEGLDQPSSNETINNVIDEQTVDSSQFDEKHSVDSVNEAVSEKLSPEPESPKSPTQDFSNTTFGAPSGWFKPLAADKYSSNLNEGSVPGELESKSLIEEVGKQNDSEQELDYGSQFNDSGPFLPENKTLVDPVKDSATDESGLKSPELEVSQTLDHTSTSVFQELPQKVEEKLFVETTSSNEDLNLSELHPPAVTNDENADGLGQQSKILDKNLMQVPESSNSKLSDSGSSISGTESFNEQKDMNYDDNKTGHQCDSSEKVNELDVGAETLNEHLNIQSDNSHDEVSSAEPPDSQSISEDSSSASQDSQSTLIVSSSDSEDQSILDVSYFSDSFEKVLQLYSYAIINLKENVPFSFMFDREKQEISSSNQGTLPVIEEANDSPVKEEKESLSSILPSMSDSQSATNELLSNLHLDSFLSSTCMRAQSLLFFFTTALTILLSAACFFYFQKRTRDASFYQRIDFLEKQLFISKKEALEYEKKTSISKNEGNLQSDLLNSAQKEISDLEVQRNELAEKVNLLSNELHLTTNMKKDLEKKLQEVLASTQNTEMILKTVDQLQQRIEMQQKSSIELNVQLKSKDKTIEGLEESLQKAVAYGNQLEELVAAIKKENEKFSIESSGKIINLNSELDQVRSEKTLEATKFKSEIDGLKISLEQTRSALDIAEANIAELKSVLSEDVKNLDNLNDIYNATELKARLVVSELNVEKLKDRIQEETGARQFLEEHVASITEAMNKLKVSYEDLEKEKSEAENAVKVLKDYFKKQEEELKKEIELKSAFQLQKDEEMLFVKIKQLEEEKDSLKSQIEDMKKEILEQENLFKRERVQLEKKADDNWLLSRQINRKLQDSKQEATILRNRLTAVEKLLGEKNQGNLNENDQSPINGDGLQQLPNVPSPPMFPSFPNAASPSFAKFSNPDFIPPPPLVLPGSEFIPPPPIYPADHRLPPLGSVARIPSPPRGMSPLPLGNNFSLNFSPPPPHGYYYQQSDLPNDYDASYSKVDKYRRDSPSFLEGNPARNDEPDSPKKLTADQPDLHPSSIPPLSSQSSPIKPVARNLTSSGQKGWTSAGQSSKPIEKNSRNSRR